MQECISGGLGGAPIHSSKGASVFALGKGALIDSAWQGTLLDFPKFNCQRLFSGCPCYVRSAEGEA